MSRSCGTCTKCCEGWLSGEAHGYKFSPGNPCFFLQQNVGCQIYDIRPKDPCESFNCLWIIDENIPEWMYPKTNEAIPIKSAIDGVEYIKIVWSGSKINDTTIQWWIEWAQKNNKNLAWDDKPDSFIGSEEFIYKMKKLRNLLS